MASGGIDAPDLTIGSRVDVISNFQDGGHRVGNLHLGPDLVMASV